MAETLGSTTVNIFEHLEAHKLHLEFEAGGTIRAGSHVKLATDGDVVEAADDDGFDLIIGNSLHNAVDTELVTVQMRARAVVIGESESVGLDAGPVELGPFNGTTLRREFIVAATAAKTVGHNLDSVAADGDAIRVALL